MHDPRGEVERRQLDQQPAAEHEEARGSPVVASGAQRAPSAIMPISASGTSQPAWSPRPVPKIRTGLRVPPNGIGRRRAARRPRDRRRWRACGRVGAADAREVAPLGGRRRASPRLAARAAQVWRRVSGAAWSTPGRPAARRRARSRCSRSRAGTPSSSSAAADVRALRRRRQIDGERPRRGDDQEHRAGSEELRDAPPQRARGAHRGSRRRCRARTAAPPATSC